MHRSVHALTLYGHELWVVTNRTRSWIQAYAFIAIVTAVNFDRPRINVSQKLYLPAARVGIIHFIFFGNHIKKKKKKGGPEPAHIKPFELSLEYVL